MGSALNEHDTVRTAPGRDAPTSYSSTVIPTHSCSCLSGRQHELGREQELCFIHRAQCLGEWDTKNSDKKSGTYCLRFPKVPISVHAQKTIILTVYIGDININFFIPIKASVFEYILYGFTIIF
jgi:hypothetical protein